MATGTTRLLRSRPALPLTAAELRGFDPLEPRDPHGKWIRGASLAGDLDTVRSRNPKVQLEVHPLVSASQPTARLSLIRTAPGERGKGHAEAAMRDLTAVADRHGTTLTLTPEPLAGDRSTSKARLTEFYKRHGFVENKGRGRDLSISDSMYRLPSRPSAEKNVLMNLGTEDEEKVSTPPARVAGFVSKAAPAADRLVGAKSTSYKSTLTIPVEGNWGTLGWSDWEGKLALRSDEAGKLDEYLRGGTVDDPDAFGVVLHELIHMAGRDDQADKSAYRDVNLAEIEEGFTELGSTQHFSEFAKAMGVGARPTALLARGPDGGPVEDAAGKLRHVTVAEMGDRMADPAKIASKSSWGHYADYVQMAQEWVEGIASAEEDTSGKHLGTRMPGALRARTTELADEINAVGVAAKPKVMASQVMRALGVKPSDLAHPEDVPGWVRMNWKAGITSGVEYVISNVKFAPRAGGIHDASRPEGAGSRRVGLAAAGAAGSRGAPQGQRARADVERPGAAGSAGRRHDAVEAGGLMQPRPLPPRPPEFRGYGGPELRFSLSQLRDPHGRFAFEHGRLKKLKSDQKLHTEAGKVRAELTKARVASKAHAVEYGPPDVSFTKDVPKPKAEALKPLADYHEYNAGFTKAQDDAAQAAARRALLAYSQKKIMEAITTPPDQMTDEQVAFATRLIGRLTGQQINEQVDRLKAGGVPDPVIKHVKGAIGDHLAEVAKEDNADARQKIITHIAAIVAAVALSLAALGFALPAVLAAIIAAFPSLAQEFIDFKHDFTTRRKAAKEAAKTATGRSALMAIELRRYDPAALRTAETPVVSTVHNPFGSPAGPGLFRVKGLELPAYIQNVAHAFTRSGVPESEAIQRAIGVVQDWAAGRTPNGKGHVHPDVQAAALKAVAEWEAAKAAAHGSK